MVFPFAPAGRVLIWHRPSVVVVVVRKEGGCGLEVEGHGWVGCWGGGGGGGLGCLEGNVS
jgi:hypothetical protein